MLQPGRSYSAGTGYRYGFNGKEMDKDLHSLTAYDYGFRIYNPAIGKFLSVDPLFKSYPWFTPYQFAGNGPILNIDVDGLENSPSQPNTQGNSVENPDDVFLNADGSVQNHELGGVTVSSKPDLPWWKRAWNFTKKEIFPRAVGALKTVGGAGMVFAGGLLSEAGIGVPILVYGADLAQAGAQQVWDGEHHETVTNKVLKAAGLSESHANVVEMAVGAAAAVETNTVLSAPKASNLAPVAEETPIVPGSQATAAATTQAASGVSNAGEMLGNFGIPKQYTYTSGSKSVFVSPHAMKHLEELATNGAKLGSDYLKLLGQTHQKALHSAIDDVLSRGAINYKQMYYSGGNEIMFGPPRVAGELPAVIHFR